MNDTFQRFRIFLLIFSDRERGTDGEKEEQVSKIHVL